jgi:hypothetical protein
VNCVYDDSFQRALHSQNLELNQPQLFTDASFGEAGLAMGQSSSTNCMGQMSVMEGLNMNHDVAAGMEIAPLDSWNDLLPHLVSEVEFQENSQAVGLTALNNQPLDTYLDPEINLSWDLQQDALFTLQNRSISPRQVAESGFLRETRQIDIMQTTQNRYGC